MSRDKLDVNNGLHCPAVKDWLDGKYPCFLTAPHFKDRIFRDWASETASELEQILGKLEVEYGVPPEWVLNVLGSYKVLLELKSKKKKDERSAREQARRDAILLKKAAMALDRQRKKLNLSGAYELRFGKPDSDKLRRAAEGLQGSTFPQPVGACAITLSDLFKRHRVRPVWPTIGKIMKKAFPKAKIVR